MTTTPTKPGLTTDAALELGDDLLVQLTERVGDLNGINAVFSRWLEVLDYDDLARVCMAALQTTFADCLTMTPLDDIPAGSHVYVTDHPEEKP